MIGNKVLGFEFAGFVISGDDCENNNKVTQYNKARSGKVGFVFTNNGGFNCIQFSHLTIHFCQEGLGFKSSTFQFSIDYLEFVENLIGMSMRTGRQNDYSVVCANLSNSVFIGKTINSDCKNCLVDYDCQQRIGYMFGTSDIGVSNISLNSKIDMPLYKQQHESNVLGQQNIKAIWFMNYNDNNDCVRIGQPITDFAISSNKDSPDYQLPQFIENIQFTNVGVYNKIFMSGTDQCTNEKCSGPMNALLVDQDGSIVGSQGGVILANNPGIAKNDMCTFNKKMNGYLCINEFNDTNNYLALMLESYDSDNQTRIFSPINITSYKATNTSVFYSGLGKGLGYKNIIFNFQTNANYNSWSRFPAIIYSGQYLNISSFGTLPGSFEFRLQTTEKKDQSVIISVHYQNSPMVQLYINYDLVVPSIEYTNGSISECKFNDSHGTNRWFYQTKIIQFVLRNEVPIMLRQQSAILLNLTINTTFAEFFDNKKQTSFINKIADALKISNNRIFIGSVEHGLKISFIIVQDTSKGSLNEPTNQLQLTELEQIQQILNI